MDGLKRTDKPIISRVFGPKGVSRVDSACFLLFFISGATGLTCQTLWFKYLSHSGGSSTVAVSATVASFLGGLGIGAFLAGLVVTRLERPLRAYGACEIAVAACVLLVPDLLHRVHGLLSFASEMDQPVHRFASSFMETFLVLLLPCILMGATLPIMVRLFSLNRDHGSVGILYGLNTLGAAAGCAVAGFILLPEFGLWPTTLLCSAAGAVVGVSALALDIVHRRSSPSLVHDSAATTSESARHVDQLPRQMVMSVAVCAGFVALAFQMVWNRQMALMLGGSTYAFTCVVFIVLTGIGVGSLAYHHLLRGRVATRYLLRALFLFAAATLLLGKLLIPVVTDVIGSVQHLRSGMVGNAVLCLLAGAVVQLLPCIAFGAIFPALADSLGEKEGGAPGTPGEAAGGVYGWNTVGALLGAVSTPFLFPVLGTVGAIGVGVAICVVVAAIVGAADPARYRVSQPDPADSSSPLTAADVRGSQSGSVGGGPSTEAAEPVARGGSAVGAALAWLFVALLAFIMTATPPDPLTTEVGTCLYGRLDGKRKLIFRHEGSTASVLVTDMGRERSLHINGKIDASNSNDMKMQLGLAFLPLFLKPGAENVLAIGMGSGTTCGAMLLSPDVKSVTCCEIEPGVVEASRHFAGVNHSPLDDTRLRMVLDDGRAFLARTRRSYSLILSEPSNPWIAGVGNLFAREFYETAARRLRPGGVLAQWIQTYSCSVADYALIVRTIRTVFDHCVVLRVSDADTILLAAAEPIEFRPEVMTLAQQMVDRVDTMERDLVKYFGTADVRSIFLQNICLRDQDVDRFLRQQWSATINTDVHPRLEFDAPRRLFAPPANKEVNASLFAAADGSWIASAVRDWRCGPPHAEALFQVRQATRQFHPPVLGGALVTAGLLLDPEHVGLQAERVLLSDRLTDDEVVSAVAAIVKRSDKGVAQAGRVGFEMWRRKRFLAATEVFRCIVKERPSSSYALTNLGVNLSALGRHKEAAALIRKAHGIDPLASFPQQELGRLRLGDRVKVQSPAGKSAGRIEAGANRKRP